MQNKGRRKTETHTETHTEPSEKTIEETAQPVVSSNDNKPNTVESEENANLRRERSRIKVHPEKIAQVRTHQPFVKTPIFKDIEPLNDEPYIPPQQENKVVVNVKEEQKIRFSPDIDGIIEGEDYPPYKNGLPDYVRLKNIAVAKKLGESLEIKGFCLFLNCVFIFVV